MDSLISDALRLHQHCSADVVLRPATGLTFLGRSGAPPPRSQVSPRLGGICPTTPRRISASSRNGALASNSVQGVPKRTCEHLHHQIWRSDLFAGSTKENLRASPSPDMESNNGVYIVGDFMTKKEDLILVKPSTSVDEALEKLVEYRITGFPVVNDDWTLVGVVSDYDLLALDSISGPGRTDTSMFPEVNRTWKTFNEIQKLLSKNNGKLIGEVMTPAPLVVRETTNLEDAARLLLETKYRRLPVVDGAGKLIGIITRGNVVRAALDIKHANAKKA